MHRSGFKSNHFEQKEQHILSRSNFRNGLKKSVVFEEVFPPRPGKKEAQTDLTMVEAEQFFDGVGWAEVFGIHG